MQALLLHAAKLRSSGRYYPLSTFLRVARAYIQHRPYRAVLRVQPRNKYPLREHRRPRSSAHRRCKKLSIVCGPQVYKYARGRKEGFLEVIRTHDLVERPSWMLQIPNNNFGLAYSAICHMLESPNRPDGVFACSDTYAAAVIRAAKKCGLEVPRDLMVVGFDNTDTAAMTTPALTTISQPRYDMGFSACNLLIERMDGSDSASSMLLETELVVRESTIRK